MKREHAAVVGIDRSWSLRPECEEQVRDLKVFDAWLLNPPAGAVPPKNVTKIASPKYESANSGQTHRLAFELPWIKVIATSFARLHLTSFRPRVCNHLLQCLSQR